MTPHFHPISNLKILPNNYLEIPLINPYTRQPTLAPTKITSILNVWKHPNHLTGCFTTYDHFIAINYRGLHPSLNPLLKINKDLLLGWYKNNHEPDDALAHPIFSISSATYTHLHRLGININIVEINKNTRILKNPEVQEASEQPNIPTT